MNNWSSTATVTWIDKVTPTATVNYDITWMTNQNVIATLAWFSDPWITITNNWWLQYYTFTGNGSFTFEFTEPAGNTWSTTATVNWIDKEAPTYTWVVDGSMNTSPINVWFTDNITGATAMLTWLVYDVWDNLVATWYVYTKRHAYQYRTEYIRLWSLISLAIRLPCILIMMIRYLQQMSHIFLIREHWRAEISSLISRDLMKYLPD